MTKLPGLLICIGLVAFAAACQSDAADGPPAAEAAGPPAAPPPSVRVAVVEEGDVERTVAFTGEVLADRRVDLAPLESGRLQTLAVDVGDRVAEGDVVATLDEAVQRTLRDERRRDVQTASAQVDVARAELAQHLADLDRRRALADRGAITRAELAALEDRVPVLEANIELAETRQATARTRLAAVDTDLDRREVRSPFDGVVVERHAVPGATVSPQAPILTLVDPTTLEFVGRIPERALAEVAVGHRVRIQVDALGDGSIEGPIRRLGGDVDRESRTVEVRVGLDDTDVADRLLDGMFGRGQIVIEEDHGTLVPVEALGRGPAGGSVVWTVADDVASQIDAQVGLQDDAFATVAGIAPGQRVVLRPPRGLEDGGPVIVVGAGAEPEGSADGGGDDG